MSHMTVVVAIPGAVPREELRGELEKALAPYDETLEVKPYVGTSKAEVDADERFQKWWKEASTPAFALSGAANGERRYTYAEAVREWYGGETDKDGNVLSTYNPKSQWDWWVVGGRWAGHWKLKDGAERAIPSEPGAFTPDEIHDLTRGDAARKSEIVWDDAAEPFAYVDLAGEWHEKGRMGWWGMTHGEMAESQWVTAFSDWLGELPDDTWLVLVDAHI